MTLHLVTISKVIKKQVPDLVLHCNDDAQVLGHSLVLALHSPLIAEIIAGSEQEGMVGITIDATSSRVRDVMELLEDDTFEIVDESDVTDLFGIRKDIFKSISTTETPASEKEENEINMEDEDTSDIEDNTVNNEKKNTKKSDLKSEVRKAGELETKKETKLKKTESDKELEIVVHETNENETSKDFNYREEKSIAEKDDYLDIRTSEDLKKFILREPVTKLSVCGICTEFRHKSMTNVSAHIEAKHFPNLFTYKCIFCTKTFNANYYLAKARLVKVVSYN